MKIEPNAMAEAAKWTSRVFTIVGVFILPGLAGGWLDNYLGTTPMFAVTGLIAGFIGGIYSAIHLTKEKKK